MKNMERELICPVCKEMYKQPLALPCMHNVCHVCASEILVQHGYICCDPSSEPTSPASTPATRSPRMGRRLVPKPDRLDRLLKSGFGTYPAEAGAVHPNRQLPVRLPAGRGPGRAGPGQPVPEPTLERVVSGTGTHQHRAPHVRSATPAGATKGTECKRALHSGFKLNPLGHPEGPARATPPLTFRPMV
ncbi:tripartite motif containing 46 [Chelydra serpentina]|uniref:Tripartite motif containing 46 n=1 Tax=Chelydra serpentina TaxID=8475 RepID=A0A8T1RXN2_CHESE|nr:tripartite motif containing 46 [Chelydra serpentina]